jgi:MazG family protein
MSHQEFSRSFIQLLDVVARLRSPQGCPWDARQTPQSLKPHLREECYEVLEAIDQDSPQALKQELGDLLLQIVLIARICEEGNLFHMGEVAESITEKLIRRHPHVFARARVESMAELDAQWDAIKAREPERPAGLLKNIPKALPALARAQKMTSKAARAGFDWPDPQGVFAKITEELQEFHQAWENLQAREMEAEFGDILLSLANLARFLGIDAENALQKTLSRFQDRFEYMETRLNRQYKKPWDISPEEWDELWEEAKKRPGTGRGKR